MIPSGMRAFTILSPHVASGVAGFILPGNRVDVLLTVAMGGGNDLSGGGTTMTLVQNLEILAVDQRLDAPSENKVDPNLHSVTLLVTPDQASRLDLGQNKGMLHLSLRNPEDVVETDSRPATLADLFRVDKPEEEPVKVEVPVKVEEPSQVVMVAAPKEPARLEIRTLRGTQSDVIQLRQPSDMSDTP
jgi:pilus assembly protein CpaB